MTKSAVTKGEVEYALRRAYNAFDKWNDVTGMFEKNTGYYYEILGCLEDAVHCGIQIALDQKERKLPSELREGR